MEALHTLEHKGYTIEIHHDEGGESPRDWDNTGIFVMFHNRYNFGDKHSFASPDELEGYIERTNMVSLPVYMYEHSGITIRTTPFGCEWDSGQIGYIFMSAAQARECESPYAVLEGEIETLDSYIRGEVYGYKIIDADGIEMDSLWGFIGDMNYCISEAKDMAEYYDRTFPKQYELALA
jgi:hypothetical protein